MHKSGYSVTLMAFVVMLLLFGTQFVNAQSGKFPVGSYESGPFTITFKEGGNFEVVHSSGGGVKGTYKITGNEAEVTDLEGDFACPDSVGRYTWKVEAEKLVFNLVEDKCDGRAGAFSMPLTKKSAK